MKKYLVGQHQIIIAKKISKHQETTSQQLNQYYHQAQASGDIRELDSEILRSCLNKVVIIEALISLIVVRNLSFYLAEWPEFHTLCQALNLESKGIITTSHSGIYNKVSEAWVKYKDIV